MSDEKMKEAIQLLKDYRGEIGGAEWTLDDEERETAKQIEEVVASLEQAAQRQGGEAVAYAVIDDDEIIEVQESKGDAEYLAQQEGGKVVPLYGKSTPQPAVAEGWKLVPIEPTKEMREAFHAADDEYQSAKFDVESPDHHWTALLEAAPEPPEDV